MAGSRKAFEIKDIDDDFIDLERVDGDEDETGLADDNTVKTGNELETYIEDIADTVRIGLDQSISILTPWFFNNMPRIYYQTTPRPEKVRHLSAIITGHVFETKQTVELWDRDRSKVTYIGPGGDRKILLDMARKLHTIKHVKMGALYFSRDKLLFLSTFFCSEPRQLDRENNRIAEKIKHARKLMLEEFPELGELIDDYLANIDNDFVIYATPARLQITFRMVRYLLSHEGALTLVEPIDGSPTARLTLGMKNVRPSEVMESIIHLFYRYDYNVVRAFVVNFTKGVDEPLTVMHFILDHASGSKVERDSIPLLKLTKALRTLGWVDTDDYVKFTREPYSFSINAANLIRATATWVHLFLGKDNPYIYSQYKIQRTYFAYAELTAQVVELFRIKFDPLKAELRDAGEYAKCRAAIDARVDEIVEEIDRNIFKESLNFIDHVLRTNYFISSKTGLAFRIDPKVLDPGYYPDLPYGIFYIIGRGFRCFQVRWKDIARGGLRVVMPRTTSDHDYALAGLFDEVYALSYAQQLKNKDIPEGGSKAVLLLKPKAHRDQAVRSAVNALLDLLVSEDESQEGLAADQVDYLNSEEIIYLGPDENMTNELIEWVPTHAHRRGYRYARAFMSSKPGDGINHKEYGVTSEGVNVYVDNILRFMGINPKKDVFTIKMTGGPDGDVAGNELKILYREYGENARLVAISDGFGAGYDPAGLAWSEILRLVESGLSIAEFSPSALSGHESAFVIKADNNQNIRTRNELFFKAETDIFIPAGGRPYTVNDKNWRMFLNAEGKPTMRAIVEGANIFFTGEARQFLQKEGILMVKDSSANKTGVICSSYEIIACLVLSAKEFAEIKEEYVRQVIDILRVKADSEAKLLIRYFERHGGERSLVDLSMDISLEINSVTDCLLEEIERRRDEVLQDPMFHELIFRHCPPILVEKYRDRILKQLPPAHQVAILAAFIASYIVYREGLGWLHSIPEKDRFDTARSYMEKDRMATMMISAVTESNVAFKGEIAQILARSAARDLTILEMEQLVPSDEKEGT